MMGWGGYDMGGWGMAAGLLIWVLLIGLAVWVVWRLTSVSRAGGLPPGDTAEDVLRRRFAAGEIDAEEYERRMTVLRKH
jgi:putative membrane protein